MLRRAALHHGWKGPAPEPVWRCTTGGTASHCAAGAYTPYRDFLCIPAEVRPHSKRDQTIPVSHNRCFLRRTVSPESQEPFEMEGLGDGTSKSAEMDRREKLIFKKAVINEGERRKRRY
jgi:hypothetical protein